MWTYREIIILQFSSVSALGGPFVTVCVVATKNSLFQQRLVSSVKL